jgi:beta-aspartyl-peptidase (threonine type)
VGENGLSKKMSAKILVHGGAGFWKKNLRRGLPGVTAAASSGMEILRRGGSALDAVELAVSVMEDDPVFNAGKGSSLTLAGTVEMDAAIMDGKDLSAGAVALVRKVKNPIRLARLIMENTDHVLLAGKSAEKLASALALPTVNPVTSERRRIWRDLKKKRAGAGTYWIRKNDALLQGHPEISEADTVGAVAVDEEGNFAAASSTGGLTLKLPGRIGDTPQIGSGLYADNLAGAATATGLGEVIIRLALSKTVCEMMERGTSAQRAADLAIGTVSRRLKGDAGVIVIDRQGRSAAVHNTICMPWAISTAKMRTPRARPHGRIIAPLR